MNAAPVYGTSAIWAFTLGHWIAGIIFGVLTLIALVSK